MKAVAAAACVLALAATAAGCGDDDGSNAKPSHAPPPMPSKGRSIAAHTPDERVIRQWIDALNGGRFRQAADYFARGAIVAQANETRLDSEAEAVHFNEGLPCRADVTDFEKQGHATLAAFHLRPGRKGACADGGRARVRFVIRGGLIREWRQLPDEAGGPPEQSV